MDEVGVGWGLNLEMEGSVEALTPLLVSCGPPCTHSLAAVREVRVETIINSTLHHTSCICYTKMTKTNSTLHHPTTTAMMHCIAGNTLQCIDGFLFKGFKTKPNFMICHQTVFCLFASPDKHGVLWFICLFVCLGAEF